MSRMIRHISHTLILCVLLSSFNWEVNYHLCCGNIVSVGVFVSPDSCSEETDDDCGLPTSEDTLDKDCCKDVSVNVSNNEQKRKFASHSNHLFRVAQLISTDLGFKFQSTEAGLTSLDIPPPWKSNQLYKQIQIFLI